MSFDAIVLHMNNLREDITHPNQVVTASYMDSCGLAASILRQRSDAVV